MDFTSIVVYVLIGFVAQTIDGALGMAYGVISNTFLLGAGLTPALASASVHTAELFTTLISGISHLRLRNVDKPLFGKLLIPGVLGGVLGAYILTSVPGEAIKPYITGYLVIMGLLVLRKAFKAQKQVEIAKGAVPLGLIGGFCDAVGGGGWGPVVTSTLMAKGLNPRLTIGTVNCAEFFVTAAQAAAFFLALRAVNWQVILGLAIGGVIAAPLAAIACRRLPAKTLTILVGVLIVAVNVRALVLMF
ncbi:MAG: sulfite exporter TauE/SafE family protein [Patescibacteria group bacterium]